MEERERKEAEEKREEENAKRAKSKAEMAVVAHQAEVKKQRKLKEFQDALDAAPPADLDSPLAKGFAKAKMGIAEKDDLVKFIQDTQAKAIADTKKPGGDYFTVKAGGKTFEFGTPPPTIDASLGGSGSEGAAGAFGGGGFEIGSEVGELTRTIDEETGRPRWENPTKATIVPSTLAAGAGIARALLEGKEKRTKLSKDFGKALRTGLETLTGEARQANVRALRDEMVGQGLTTAENFNRVGRKMLKDIEDERTRAKIDFLRSPQGGTVSAPGIDRLKEMQGRAFGTSTALRGSVGRLGDASRSLGTERGRLRKEARAMEGRGHRSGAAQLRGAAALTGEPGISTPAYREGQRAAAKEIADLQKRLIEAHIANQEAAARRNANPPDQPGSDIDPGFYLPRPRGKVNPSASQGAGYGTPIKQ